MSLGGSHGDGTADPPIVSRTVVYLLRAGGKLDFVSKNKKFLVGVVKNYLRCNLSIIMHIY